MNNQESRLPNGPVVADTDTESVRETTPTTTDALPAALAPAPAPPADPVFPVDSANLSPTASTPPVTTSPPPAAPVDDRPLLGIEYCLDRLLPRLFLAGPRAEQDQLRQE